jgi:hypothetical protein
MAGSSLRFGDFGSDHQPRDGKAQYIGGTIKEPDAAEKESVRKTDPMNWLRMSAYLPFRGLGREDVS